MLRGLYNELDADPEADRIGTVQTRRSGWKFEGVSESSHDARLTAHFYYSVEDLKGGVYEENPALAAKVMRPSRLEYTLSQMETIKAERLFSIAVPEATLEKGIKGILHEAALGRAFDNMAAQKVCSANFPLIPEELALQVA